MSPSDPDKTRLPSASLPFWDLMRFVWRGRIGLTARCLPFFMSLSSEHKFWQSMRSMHLAADLADLVAEAQAPSYVHVRMGGVDVI